MRCVKSCSIFVSTSSTDCSGASSGAGAGGASSKSALRESTGFILGAGVKAAAPAMINALRSIIVWRSCGHYEAVLRF